MTKAKVAIIMGSDSDWPVMKNCEEILAQLGVALEVSIVSAHRTPDLMFEFAKSAEERGLQVIVAGAGGAAHLPGMVASLTNLPVIGVPIKASHSLDGWDSVLSILQMPGGVPVATMALDGAKNAGLLAAQIVALGDTKVKAKLQKFKKAQTETVLKKRTRLKKTRSKK